MRIVPTLVSLLLLTVVNFGCQDLANALLTFPDTFDSLDLVYPDIDSLPWDVVIGQNPLAATIRSDGGVVSRSVADDGLVVEVFQTGLVALVGFQTREISQQQQLGAVATAFSNDGRRLALVTRDDSQPQPDAHRLLITDRDLAVESEIRLDLPLPDERSEYRTFIVSWSADDSHLSVSTDASQLDESFIESAVTARCVIVALDDGSSVDYQLTNVYYVDNEFVVGTVPESDVVEDGGAAENVYLMRLSNDRQIEDKRFVHGSQFAVASYPKGGLYLSRDERWSITPDDTRNSHLRSLTGRARRWTIRTDSRQIVSLFPRFD